MPSEGNIRVLSYEDYPQILELLREDVIDCTIGSQMRRQGKLPVTLLMNYLLYDQKPEKEHYYTDIQILVKECMD